MKYFIIIYVSFSLLLFVILGEINSFGKWKHLNPKNPNVIKWAEEGVNKYNNQTNKTFVLVRVINAKSRIEVVSVNITRKRRKIDCTAKRANCSKKGGCKRYLRTVILKYSNGTEILRVDPFKLRLENF